MLAKHIFECISRVKKRHFVPGYYSPAIIILLLLVERVTYGLKLDNVYDRTCLEERNASRGVSKVCSSYV